MRLLRKVISSQWDFLLQRTLEASTLTFLSGKIGVRWILHLYYILHAMVDTLQPYIISFFKPPWCKNNRNNEQFLSAFQALLQEITCLILTAALCDNLTQRWRKEIEFKNFTTDIGLVSGKTTILLPNYRLFTPSYPTSSLGPFYYPL